MYIIYESIVLCYFFPGEYLAASIVIPYMYLQQTSFYIFV